MKRAIEIILKDDVQEVLDSFALCFGIRILFYSPDKEIMRFGDNRIPDSRYCQLMMDKLYGAARCHALDEERFNESAEKRAMVSYTCHAGLEAIMPLYAETHLLGFVMIGQVRTQEEIPSAVAEAWSAKYPTKKLETAYAELPFVPPERVEHMLHLFTILVNYIVSQHMVESRGNLIVMRVLEYVETHLDKPIRLKDVSAFVYRSESTVSHLVREKLGKTFKQVVIDSKLDKAEEYMRTAPGITVAEVAAKIGYTDPFHFSTMYRKHRGHRPSDVLRKHKA